ncbi:cilia- and flagella-associated protein 276 [Ambystoma mexicanum]|uniref:cilia- and flagella-associated protein 276 n=1 Tax=Ambystoma mexicanum TaxID=8296 RepID=UPI0037E8C3FB
MPTTRDPFPYPKYENDTSYCGWGPVEQGGSYSKPTHLAQNEDPWNRLHATPTLSSARRDVCYFDPIAPHDSLDFNLKTMYNHQSDLLQTKNEAIFQRETFTEDHGRILKNRVKEALPSAELKMSLKQWVSPRKQTIDSVHGAIVGHHSAATNRGYSRKQDGGFYSI